MTNVMMKCDTHPDVVAAISWGCPDCLYEVKRELSHAMILLRDVRQTVNPLQAYPWLVDAIEAFFERPRNASLP